MLTWDTIAHKGTDQTIDFFRRSPKLDCVVIILESVTGENNRRAAMAFVSVNCIDVLSSYLMDDNEISKVSD